MGFMMKTCIMALQIMISFLLIAGRSNGRLLMKNNDGPGLHIADGNVKKDAVQRDQERNPRSSSSVNSATDDKKLSLRRSMTVQKTEKSKAEGVFNLPPKGKVTPSGSSPTVDSMVTEQELSTSNRSPGVGHMQMIRPKSQTISVRIIKSVQSHGDDRVQQETSSQRKLGSTPSPGDGNSFLGSIPSAEGGN